MSIFALLKRLFSSRVNPRHSVLVQEPAVRNLVYQFL